MQPGHLIFGRDDIYSLYPSPKDAVHRETPLLPLQSSGSATIQR